MTISQLSHTCRVEWISWKTFQSLCSWSSCQITEVVKNFSVRRIRSSHMSLTYKSFLTFSHIREFENLLVFSLKVAHNSFRRKKFPAHNFTFIKNLEFSQHFLLKTSKLTCNTPYFSSISRKLYSTAWAGRMGICGCWLVWDAPDVGVGKVTSYKYVYEENSDWVKICCDQSDLQRVDPSHSKWD